jgi:thiol:disulfide interchange protein DsbC
MNGSSSSVSSRRLRGAKANAPWQIGRTQPDIDCSCGHRWDRRLWYVGTMNGWERASLQWPRGLAGRTVLLRHYVDGLEATRMTNLRRREFCRSALAAAVLADAQLLRQERGKIMRSTLAAIAAVFLLLSTSARADEAAIRNSLRQQMPENAIGGVTKTPIPGLFEVVVENRIVYVTEDGRYILGGPLIDQKANQNLTKARLDKINAVPFDSLPLDLAIKRVKGNGSRKMAIFEDPDCPYCKKLEQELKGVDNVTVYIFLYPIEEIHPGATDKAQAIWCAKDRVKAWDDVMFAGAAPSKPAGCDTPIAKIVELGRRHRIVGTPTAILADGRRVVGALPRDELEKELARSMTK